MQNIALLVVGCANKITKPPTLPNSYRCDDLRKMSQILREHNIDFQKLFYLFVLETGTLEA